MIPIEANPKPPFADTANPMSCRSGAVLVQDTFCDTRPVGNPTRTIAAGCHFPTLKEWLY
jgi:hypothetical protein